LTLNEAFAIINSSKRTGTKKVHYLACGFEPLHLATFMQAHLLGRLLADDVAVQTGIYGDLRGNIQAAAASPATAAGVVLEWSDVDPRLGLRSSGGWGVAAKAGIIATAAERFAQLETAIVKLAARMPAAVARPSLPLPPIGNTIRAQSSVLELDLEQQLAAFLLRISQVPGVRIVHGPQTGPLVPAHARLDAGMELLAGFPYTVPFADELAKSLADALHQTSPKKGLITDLDETLWSGIVGDVGIDGISWDQEHHTQIHGLYQQMLGHLAACGVLLAVSSKNESTTVEAALAREDLLLDAASLFPVCSGWGPKSASVGQILRAWNIGEDAVVFVDDNPMELAEVQQAYPGIACRQFRAKNPAQVWNLLGELRDLFGKPLLTEEDGLRQASLRASAQIQELGENEVTPEFLRGLEGALTVSWHVEPSDKRPLELINKTNQFNLNGLRIEEGQWLRLLDDPHNFLAVGSYRDKFGPLGKIAVAAGSQIGGKVTISHWVMSCRAFSRRIEHHTLDCLFRRSNADEVEFAFRATEKNQPLRAFFDAIGICPGPDGSRRITRAAFLARCGYLPHHIPEVER